MRMNTQTDTKGLRINAFVGMEFVYTIDDIVLHQNSSSTVPKLARYDRVSFVCRCEGKAFGSSVRVL